MPDDQNDQLNPDEVQDQATLEDEEATTDLRYQISSYGADYPVDGLVKRLENDDIILPKFQREFVWPLPQASKFIESLLLGLPVPAIFFSKEAESQKLLVIDGQQRLKSLLFFYRGLFRGKEFRLQGVNAEFEGTTYKTLPQADRRRLDDAILHAIIIRQEDPQNDDSSVFLVFERLNTTSTPLSEQEIRACVYHGEFNDYLQEANKNADWRAIFGDPNPRQKDKELILRFFALHFDITSYERPMKIFLTNFMRKNRHLELYPPELLNTTFSPTVKIAHEALGRATFRPQRALNASVTDAILAGTAKRLALGPITDNAAYKAAIEAAISSATFADLYKVGTTNKDKVTGRIGRIADALLGVH
ncbi:MAG: DUF262 domain-containing protein [Terriglobia bacterium]|jgi:hypothetical protein